MQEGELIKKFGIDLESIKREQAKLAKCIELKDKMDFNLATKFGAIEIIIINNQIISVAIICNNNFEILEEQYFLDKLRFPYLFEFRSYRELPAMVEAFNKLQDKPDVIFIHGHGITHPALGLASHFSLSTGIPCFGVADSLFECDKVQGQDILRNDKVVGKVLQSKENSNPLYISPGNFITLRSAYELSEKMIRAPHKLPEPLHLAHKYARSVKKELKI